MKKALIPATLILAVSLSPFLPTPVCLADPSASATSVLASSLFWRLIDVFRTSELSSAIPTARDTRAPELLHEIAGVMTPAFVNVVVEHSIALDQPASTPQNFNFTMSISACAVRRIVEREIKTFREESAGRQSGRQDRNSNHDTDRYKEKT
jgi:hypothetical protein